MPSFRKSLSCLSLTAFLLSGQAPFSASAATPTQKDRAAIADGAARASAVVACYVERESPAGMSFSVFYQGAMTRSDGFGWADLEQQVPVTRETRFRMASVSKLVAAGALAQLWQKGKLDIDAPVRTYIPEFPEKQWAVSLRQLAGHIGGVRGYEDKDFEAGNNINLRRFETTDDALTIFADDPLIFEPGTGYRYSVFGFTLLSAVIERVSDKPYADYIRDDFLAPLGVTTISPDNPDALVAGRGRFYDVAEDGSLVNAEYVRSDYKLGGGGLLGTAEALARFGSAHIKPGLFTEQTLDNGLFKPQVREDGRPVHVGLGWRVGDDSRFGRVYHHSGSLPGARSVLMLWPDEDLVVAAMSNTSNAPHNAEDFADALSHMILDARPATQAKDKLSLDLVFGDEKDSAVRHLDTTAQAACEGTLQTPAYLKAGLEKRGYRAPETLNIMGSYFDAGGQLVVLVASRLGLHCAEIDLAARTGRMVDLDNKFAWSVRDHPFSLR